MANYPVQDMEGIGPAYGEKLVAAGVKDTDGLLNAAKTAKGRKELSEKTGLPEGSILKWTNMADLYRLNGVGSEYAELLEASGVDTVKELKHRNAANLAEQMTAVNTEKKLTRRVPNADQLQKWIDEAKTLPPMIEH